MRSKHIYDIIKINLESGDIVGSVFKGTAQEINMMTIDPKTQYVFWSNKGTNLITMDTYNGTNYIRIQVSKNSAATILALAVDNSAHGHLYVMYHDERRIKNHLVLPSPNNIVAAH